MSRVRRAAVATMACAALTLAGLAVAGAQTAQARVRTAAAAKPSAKGDPARTRQLALQAGLQIATKHRDRPMVKIHGKTLAAPNPYLAEVPAGTRIDWSYWRRLAAGNGQQRVETLQRGLHNQVAVPTPYTYDEAEGTAHGANDSQADAERLTKLGVGKQFQAVKIAGRLSPPSVTLRSWATHEDQGSIPLATRTGIGYHRSGVKLTSRIGDGAHGSAGDGHGDFDFYRVHAKAGDSIKADTNGSNFDTVLVVYDRKGNIVAANDDTGGQSITSTVVYRSAKAADYFVMVGGFSDFGSVPETPFHSGSGAGAGDQGTYHLRITGSPLDEDQYAVQLASGDVLGGVLNGRAATLRVHRLNGHTAIGTQQDMSASYPPQSPLPGGGATFAYVAEEPGWYTVSAAGGEGTYRVLLETYKPGALRADSGKVQTIFLDFDGERLNTGIFGGPGVRTLSPLRSFLPKWGLTPADEGAVIDAVVARVRRITQDLRSQGLNRQVRINIRNSRDNPDPFGGPDASRIVVGGTIDQTGIPTIGISQSVDPGNFGHEETAMVLLDEVSLPKGAEDSFNTYLRPNSNRVAFIGQALGNLVAHEAGHLLGSFHTDSLDTHVNLMDAGGTHFDRFFGVGPDGVGGTSDDTDVAFGDDRYDPDEGFLGVENTLNFTTWALLAGAG